MSWSDEIKEDDIFELKTENVDLLFNGHNYLWWKKTEKRLNKFEANLMSKPIEKKEKMAKATKTVNTVDTNDTKYSIGIATLVDNELTNIHYFEGTKQECIDFINKDMFNRYVDDSLNAKVVINLAFDIDKFKDVFFADTPKDIKEMYKKDIEMWYTLQELEDMGAISVK
jgi:hypothetical protein